MQSKEERWRELLLSMLYLNAMSKLNQVCIVAIAFSIGLVVGPSALIAIWLATQGWFATVDGLADGVTVEGIRAIDVGMTESDVRLHLGEPIDVGPKSCSYKSDSLLPNCDKDSFTYVYTEHVALRGHPMLWVHFRNGRVTEVYAKYYYVFDDVGAYGKNSNACKPDDPKRSAGCSWERPEFEKYFPRQSGREV
jgi:hypothetical protein